MKRIAFILGGMLLLGVGCAEVVEPLVGMEKKEEPTVMTKPATPPQEPPAMMEKKNELTLQGSVMDSGQVKFTWTAPEGLTEANRFILVQGMEDNPVHDGKHNWFRQYYTNRAILWRGLSAGPTHFRMCLTENNDQDTCVKYSNDVVVDVK